MTEKKRIGELLLEEGKIDRRRLSIALSAQKVINKSMKRKIEYLQR